MSDKTRNEWQKRWLLSPLISPIVPIWNCFVIFHSFFINYLINYSILLMIFNAILSVNHIFIIYTQFYNLLFPHRSCSIGLFSVGKHTPSSQTECSHIRPLSPYNFAILSPYNFAILSHDMRPITYGKRLFALSIAHIRRTQPSCSPQALVRPSYYIFIFSCILFF